MALRGAQEGMELFEAGGGTGAIAAALKFPLGGFEAGGEVAVTHEGVEAITNRQAGTAGGAVDHKKDAPWTVAGGIGIRRDAGIEEPEPEFARIGIGVEAAEADVDADLREALLEGFDDPVEEEPVGCGKPVIHVHDALKGRWDPRKFFNAGPAVITTMRAGGVGVLQGRMASRTHDRRRVEDRGRQEGEVHDEGGGDAEE